MTKIRFYVKDSERKPDPEPMRTNPVLALSVGTVLWIVGLAVLLATKPATAASTPWIVWTCVAGAVLGVYGIWHIRRRL